MSDGLYVLHDSELPSLGEWQTSLDAMGLKLVLDRRVSPAGHGGYFPARLGRKRTGFELHQEDGADVLADGGMPTERPWKHATLLIWRDETELLAAYMAGAALARAGAGVVYDPLDNRVYTPDEALRKIEEICGWTAAGPRQGSVEGTSNVPREHTALSDSLYILQDTELPSVPDWHIGVGVARLWLQLDQSINPATHDGYFPARLGSEQTGFELHREDGSDVLAAAGVRSDKPWKHVTHLSGRNETELLAAHAAGAALACVRAGVVYDPVDGRVYAPYEAVNRIRDIGGRKVVIPKRRNIKAKIKPVLDASPELVFDRGLLFFEPIGYYLRGCALHVPPETAHIFISRFVCPLFDGVGTLPYLEWGMELRTSQGVLGWDYDSPRFTDDFAELFDREVKAAVANVTDGAAFLHYIETQRFTSHRLEHGRALAHLHTGKLALAKQEFDAYLRRWDEWPLLKEMRKGEPPVPHVETARQISDMIARNPAGLDAYLRGVAAAQIKAARLEKHWVPPKSFFDGPIDTSGI